MSDQSHGKRFEDFVKASGRFQGAADQSRSPSSSFDIEARFDRIRHLPTSVKTTGGRSVALSDARRFFESTGVYRMVVGRYRQRADTKEFFEVHECILTREAISQLRGALTFELVSAFHTGLSLRSFPRGRHIEARQWARKQKGALREISSDIVLNPKIDSASQRRLQCSVQIDRLVDTAKRFGEYELHTEFFGNWQLPIVQKSPRRR